MLLKDVALLERVPLFLSIQGAGVKDALKTM
jgi:hypothetical protein